MARPTHVKAIVPTRAFFKPLPSGWVKHFFFASCDGAKLEYGQLPKVVPASGRERASTRTFASETEARAAMDALCERKKEQGYVEIVRERQYGGFDPPIGAELDAQTKAGVLETALARSRKATPIAETPKPTKPEDPRKSLTSLVLGKRAGVRIVRHEQCVEIVTGKLVVADPMLVSDAAPLRRRIVPGSYDVTLARIEERNAVATLVLHKPAPTRWERAGECPVDSAHAAFMDYAATYVIDEDPSLQEALFFKPLVKRKVAKAGRVLSFESGDGDGNYCVYYGFAESKLVCVTIDFAIVAAPE